MIAEILHALATSALASSAAILLVLLLRKPLRARFGAHAGYALWLLVPLAAATVLLPAPVRIASIAMIPAGAVPLASAVAGPAALAPLDPIPWLFAVWLLGVGACVSLLMLQQRRFTRALGGLVAFGERDRTVLAEATAGCPALVGAWRPRIVLPADFERRYSVAERELILAHERLHLARGDAQVNTLAAALCCLNWFNPLFHFAASRFRFDQELACDAAVIAVFPEARRPYADAMLKTQLADLGLPAGCYWQSSHPLKERISMLKQPLPGRARRALGLATATALVAAGTYAAWAVQPASAMSGKEQAQSQAQSQAPASSIQLGEFQNVAPSENISYRSMKPPVYPVDAINARVGAKVIVKVLIDAQGVAKSAQIEKLELVGEPKAAAQGAIPDKAALKESFAQASKAAALSWKYNPGMKDGVGVEGYGLIPFDFSTHECTQQDPCGEHKSEPPATDPASHS